MPENLLKPLSPQEVRDLFGYLQGNATAAMTGHRSDPGVEATRP